MYSQLLAPNLCWTVRNKLSLFEMKTSYHGECLNNFIHLLHWWRKLISSLHSPIYLFSLLMKVNSFVHTFHGIISICYWLKNISWAPYCSQSSFLYKHYKFKIFWILWKMTFKTNVSLGYWNVSWQFTLPFHLFHPFAFLSFFLSTYLLWK